MVPLQDRHITGVKNCKMCGFYNICASYGIICVNYSKIEFITNITHTLIHTF
jgi:hypothetical protein